MRRALELGEVFFTVLALLLSWWPNDVKNVAVKSGLSVSVPTALIAIDIFKFLKQERGPIDTSGH